MSTSRSSTHRRNVGANAPPTSTSRPSAPPNSTRKYFSPYAQSKHRNQLRNYFPLLLIIFLLAILCIRQLLTNASPTSFIHPPNKAYLLPDHPLFDGLSSDPKQKSSLPLPAYAHLTPRHTLFSLTSPRTTLHSLNDSTLNHTALPRLHAVLVCENPCCSSTLHPAAVALVSQTLPPTRLTFVHACPPSHQSQFHHEARRALSDPTATSTSYNLRPHALYHPCRSPRLDLCALEYLSHLANTADDSAPHFTVVLTDRVLLEPTAIEKAWLSLVTRPHVSALRIQAYDFPSLQKAEKEADPLLIRSVWPTVNATDRQPVVPIPIVYDTAAYRARTVDSYSLSGPDAIWVPLINTVAAARLIREPLCTLVETTSSTTPYLFSLARFTKNQLPQQLFSELAFFKYSARHDENDMYTSSAPSVHNIDLDPIPHWPVRKKGKYHIMLVVPWMQMGGSEQCMLDIASELIERGWGVSFVFTMPFWSEDPTGEIHLRHEWYNRAVHFSSDVFDMLNIAGDEKSSRIFRYLLESRRPEFILMANSRWAYAHSAYIKAVLPSAVVADYNHMIHMSWEGGGMPRYGANNSAHFDLHLTASHDVTNAMKQWIKPELMKKDPTRVQTCYIGTDPSLLRSAEERPTIREEMREKFGFSESTIVVLFAGRFVVDKGIDVAAEVVKQVAKDKNLSQKVAFIFVGSGDQKELLTSLPKKLDGMTSTFVVVQPPATGLEELRDYYAMSDVFLLPSVNEGIALVVYEAMADGLLVITTDVGGQREVVTRQTGILLPNFRTVMGMANHTVDSLREVVSHPDRYSAIRLKAREIVRKSYTTKDFTGCVIDHMVRLAPRVRDELGTVEGTSDSRVSTLRKRVSRGVQIERFHGKWNRDVTTRSIEGYVTIGIKTYVCDDSIRNQVHNLVRSIRAHHPRVRVLLGNDGPSSLRNEPFIRDDPFTEEVQLPEDSGISFGRNYMVNMTTTRYFLLLDDDHVFDDTTNLKTVVRGLRDDGFDMVGLRVRNLPGIDEYERIRILIPRYVALIRKLEQKDLTLCVWNENNGPSVYGITHPIPVDVLHNAFMASSDVLREHPWRNILKVNEHMTFFLDAKDANLSVGYLPSVFVHHRARDYSDCYYKVRFREDKYRKLLRYKDAFLWDIKCGNDFPNRVKQHILVNELNAV